MIGSTNASARRRTTCPVSAFCDFFSMHGYHLPSSQRTSAFWGDQATRPAEWSERGTVQKRDHWEGLRVLPFKGSLQIRVRFCGTLDASSALGQPPVELGERHCGYPVDQYGGSDDEATDHPRFLEAGLPQGEGRIVECRSPYWAEPSEEQHVFRSPSEWSEQRPQGQHRGQPPEQKHRHHQKQSSPTERQPTLPRQRHTQEHEDRQVEEARDGLLDLLLALLGVA